MHSTANEAVDVAWAGCLPRSATPGFDWPLTGLPWSLRPLASGASMASSSVGDGH